MNRNALAVLILGSHVSMLAFASVGSAARGEAPAPALGDVAEERLSFYGIGLICRAAPKIGCGSKAKPILRTLAADPRISGAYLNEAGTRLAIVRHAAAAPLTTEQVNGIIEQQGVVAHDLAVDALPALVTSLRSGSGWFDAASVDRLSEREAGIIGARLVRRLSARVELTVEQQSMLAAAFERSLRERFTRSGGTDIAGELVRIGEPFLDTRGRAELKDVVALGLLPLPNEE